MQKIKMTVDGHEVWLTDDPKEAYLVYLARFCFEHFSDGDAHPMSYEEWRNA